MSHPNGRPGRGIQYPFFKPEPGQWHAEWDEAKLEPWKMVMRQLMHHHATNPNSTLRQISTEFIPNPDYGGGAKYSIFEQNVACAKWFRQTWAATTAATWDRGRAWASRAHVRIRWTVFRRLSPPLSIESRAARSRHRRRSSGDHQVGEVGFAQEARHLGGVERVHHGRAAVLGPIVVVGARIAPHLRQVAFVN